MLFDAETLAPAALLDGIGHDRRAHRRRLRARRAPPGGAAASGWSSSAPARRRARTSPRSRGAATTSRVVGRDPERTAAFAASSARAPPARTRSPTPTSSCCCTTAREPLFDGDAVPDDATVVAIGSHEPDAREVDERLVARATVVVESRPSALREAGDVIHAPASARADLHDLGELVRGEVTPGPGRPRLFKSTGMAWEDLVIARAIHSPR